MLPLPEENVGTQTYTTFLLLTLYYGNRWKEFLIVQIIIKIIQSIYFLNTSILKTPGTFIKAPVSLCLISMMIKEPKCLSIPFPKKILSHLILLFINFSIMLE